MGMDAGPASWLALTGQGPPCAAQGRRRGLAGPSSPPLELGRSQRRPLCLGTRRYTRVPEHVTPEAPTAGFSTRGLPGPHAAGAVCGGPGAGGRPTWAEHEEVESRWPSTHWGVALAIRGELDLVGPQAPGAVGQSGPREVPAVRARWPPAPHWLLLGPRTGRGRMGRCRTGQGCGDDHAHALGGHALIRPDQKQLPAGQGQSAKSGHLERGRHGDVTGCGEGGAGMGRGGVELPLAWPGGSSGRAHTCTSSSEGSGSSRRSVKRPLAGNGSGAVATGSWGQGRVLRAKELGSSPAPRPPPPQPADLGRTHAPELLRRGEDGPAEALPLAVRAAKLVVQVERDIDEPCGAGRWGRASRARPLRHTRLPAQSPPQGPSLEPSAHPGPGAPRAGAGLRRRCGWRGRGCHRSRRPEPRRARRRQRRLGGGRWPGRPRCGWRPAPPRPATPGPRAARRLRGTRRRSPQGGRHPSPLPGPGFPQFAPSTGVPTRVPPHHNL